jgi:hypothetical protein
MSCSNFDDKHHDEPEDQNQQKNKRMMCHLRLLPQELFRFLSDYLVDTGKKKVFKFNDDWRCFMNTNKAYFAELKMQTKYIDLNENSKKFLIDPLFRQRILSLVVDPSLQISCNFGEFGEIGDHLDATALSNINHIQVSDFKARSLSRLTNVESAEIQTPDFLLDINCFAHVKRRLSVKHVYYQTTTYDLSCLSSTLESLILFVPRVANYHLLTNLRSVEFYGCLSIEDVSCFRRAEIVKFLNCRKVINVNSLKNVVELVFRCCDGITDVSELGRVKRLEISDCKNLHDISCLSTVHTLTVANVAKNLLSSLNQNTVLHLLGYQVKLSSIHFLAGNKLLRVLNISKNEDIQDISMLTTVEVLNINRCHLIRSFTGLTALKELKMKGVSMVESGFEVFEQLTRLSIGKVNYWKRTTQALEKALFLSSLTLDGSNLPIEGFTQVQDLTVQNSSMLIEFPATLIHLKSLILQRCMVLVSFPSYLPSLHVLVIEGSDELSQLNIFGNPDSSHLTSVSVSYCRGLKEIRITRRISSLDILACPNLIEISGKDLVRSLKDKHSITPPKCWITDY